MQVKLKKNERKEGKVIERDNGCLLPLYMLICSSKRRESLLLLSFTFGMVLIVLFLLRVNLRSSHIAHQPANLNFFYITDPFKRCLL
jgi:hypothetical protein